jgi:hypothetical protein
VCRDQHDAVITSAQNMIVEMLATGPMLQLWGMAGHCIMGVKCTQARARL